MRNKRAETSVASLRIRIEQLEEQRRNWSMDKGLYLAALRYICFSLLFMACGMGFVPYLKANLFVVVHLPPHFPQESAIYEIARNALDKMTDIISGLFFVAAAATALTGLRLTAFDAKTKLSRAVSQLDKEIAGLKQELEARTQHV